MGIPVQALPVVRVLRRDVPRPKELPRLARCAAAVATKRRYILRFWPPKNHLLCCPMGLHPATPHAEPTPGDGFPASDEAVEAFAYWWDTQTDAQAAVDAVWPPDGGAV